MTIKQLEGYTMLKKEVQYLEERIKTCESKITCDTVQGSPDFPYAKKTIAITGLDSAAVARARKLHTQLSERRKRLDAELTAIEAFIDAVGDSKVRQIIQLRYIDGLSWTATANRIYGRPCESSARSLIERFLKKI